MQITFNNLTKADGSALINQDGTIIQATVFGPVDIPQSKANTEEAIVEILFHPKVNIPSTSPAFDKIREIEYTLKSIFKSVILTKLHPRTSVTILLQEIHDSGLLLIATINAACCALLDAGIPMKCPIAAVRIDATDPDRIFDLVFDADSNIISLLTKGYIDERSMDTALIDAMAVSKKHFEYLREKVSQRFTG